MLEKKLAYPRVEGGIGNGDIEPGSDQISTKIKVNWIACLKLWANNPEKRHCHLSRGLSIPTSSRRINSSSMLNGGGVLEIFFARINRSKVNPFERLAMLALALIGKRLDDPTLIHPAMRTACHHALKLGPQGCQAGDALFHLDQPGAGDLIGRRA